MSCKSRTIWRRMGALFLLAATFVLGGCSTRSGAGETAAQVGAIRLSEPAVSLALPTPTRTAEQPEAALPLPTPTPTIQLDEPPLLLDLPALVITYNADGVPSIGDSTPISDLNALLPPTVISQLTLDAATIQAATEAGIQHVMLSNTPSGLRILVNGQPLPAVVWDAQSLDNLLALLGPASGSAPATLRDVVATLTNLGVGLVVQLPPATDNTAAIPLIVEGEQSNAARAQAGRQEFLAGAGATPVVQIPVYYAEDGTWTVQGITDTQWQALTGLPFGYIRLNPALVRDAVAAGVEQVIVWTDADGIHLAIGDRELPYLRWADGGIHTLVDLLLRLDIVQGAAGNEAAINLLLDKWLPALQATEVRLVVYFAGE